MVPAPTSNGAGASSAWAGETFTHVINGKSFEQEGAKMLDVVNPANEKVVSRIPIATPQVVDEAVKAAQAAFKSWSKLSWDERAAYIHKWHDQAYVQLKEKLLPLYVAEQGRPLSLAEVEWGITEQFWDTSKYYKPEDEIISDDGENKSLTRMYPLGVSAALVPWNYPLVLTMWKVIPAILTGNTVIVKPSPFTPLMTTVIMREAQKVLPPGVVNLVIGDDTLGQMLTEHPNIQHISFTGSTATGRMVARSCAATLKRVTLELGGKDPCIILPGADMEHVPLLVFIAAFQNSGQFCSASKRIYVHESLYDQFSQTITAIAKATKLGDGSDPSSGMGPVANRRQFLRAQQFLADIEQKKQKVLTGGKAAAEGNGYFVDVTLVDNPDEKSMIVQEEPFAPILPLLKFSSEEEVIQRANDTQYGLGCQIWGGDIAQCERIADQIESGTVWINQLQNFTPDAVFAGWKSSGLGGGANGRKGIEAYMQPKTIRRATKVTPFGA